MKKVNEDELLRQMARQYAEQYGSRLRRENVSLRQTRLQTPRMDWTAQELHRRRRSTRRGVGWSLAAALVVFLLSYALLQSRVGDSLFDPSDNAPTTADASHSPNHSDGSFGSQVPEGEPIPLSFTLPSSFSVSDVEVDRGETIYSLDDNKDDDVVLKLSYSADSNPLPMVAGLTTFHMGDKTCYGLSTPDFKMLWIEKDGILYEMSCRYDYSTLLTLGERI